jgi:hypothetical protein
MKAFLAVMAAVVVGLIFFPNQTIMGLILWGLAIYVYHTFFGI